jgi:hypothetical protein
MFFLQVQLNASFDRSPKLTNDLVHIQGVIKRIQPPLVLDFILRRKYRRRSGYSQRSVSFGTERTLDCIRLRDLARIGFAPTKAFVTGWRHDCAPKLTTFYHPTANLAIH